MRKSPNVGSSALLVLSNREKVARVGLTRRSIPIQGAKDNFSWKLSLYAVLDWFLGRSIQLLSTRSAGEPTFGMESTIADARSEKFKEVGPAVLFLHYSGACWNAQLDSE